MTPRKNKLLDNKMAGSQLCANFDTIEEIGKGGYGKVVKATSKTDKKDYAIKIVEITEDINVERELEALRQLEHKNVVKYCTSWHDTNALLIDDDDDKSVESQSSEESSKDPREPIKILCIQMELCQSTLKEKLKIKLSEYEISHLFHQICSGLQHIHSKNIIHRDLKPANVLITNENCLKIGDFGLSRTAKPTLQIQHGPSEEASGSLTHAYIGTPLYTAPEIEIKDGKYDEKVDIYSLGVIYFEMCYYPFKTEMERDQVLRNLRLKEIKMPDNFNKRSYIQLIRQLLNHTPEERPTVTMILNQIPPSVDNINQIVQKIDTSVVSKQTVSIYLRKFTRKEDVEGISDINVMEHSYFGFANYRFVVSRIVDKVNDKLIELGANYLTVPLFLPKSHMYFNVSTDICLLNDKSAAVYAIPSDRRLCYIYYLKNNDTLVPRYSIDAIYEGNKNDTYDEVTECNYDKIDGSIVDQIVLQINLIESILPIPVVINVNHKSLYDGTMSCLNISEEDREILEKSLLIHEKVNIPFLKKHLHKKSKIRPTTILKICSILKEENLDLRQQKEFKRYMAETEEFIKKLRENNIRWKINVKPFIVPHSYSSGIIYEIVTTSQNNLRISKGSEYKVHDRRGVGFSLNISNVAMVLFSYRNPSNVKQIKNIQ